MTDPKQAKVEPITPAAHRLLVAMDQAEREERFEDADIVGERNEWWCGHHRTTWGVVKQLLQRCLISCVSNAEKVERYTINEHGRAAILDRTFVPPEILSRVAGHE